MNAANMRRRPPSIIHPNDYGGLPYVADINGAVIRNSNFRTALWTGQHLQMVLMSVPPNGEIGLEVHRDVDQFLYVVSGSVIVLMGNSRGNLSFRQTAVNGYGIFVPAGLWHNIVNAGNQAVKLYTVYAPPDHPRNTIEPYPPDAPVPPPPVRPPISTLPAAPLYPATPVRPPSNSVPATPTYPATPVRPPSNSVPATPTYPATPVRPPSNSVPATPMYPATPVRPPSNSVPATPTYPATFMPLSQEPEVDGIYERATEI